MSLLMASKLYKHMKTYFGTKKAGSVENLAL